MLYPPIKRGYVPEAKKTKDLANLMNINSKFTGSGGSKHRNIFRFLVTCTEKALSLPKPSVSGIFKTDK